MTTTSKSKINILVPTDFSALSKIAVKYAVKVANYVEGSITLVHVINMVKPVSKRMTARMKPVEDELIREATEQLEKLERAISKSVQFSEPVRLRVIASGDAFDEVVSKEAKKQRSGLIVMGTHGASGFKRLMGSNTTAVISSSDVPVLVIPEDADFKGFRNVVYASDLKHVDKELKVVVPFVKRFESCLHLVHVVKSGKEVPALEEKVETLVRRAGYKDIVVMILADANIDSGIEDYIGNSKGELLTMFTHKLSFYEKILGKSTTRRMAFHSKVPLLAVK